MMRRRAATTPTTTRRRRRRRGESLAVLGRSHMGGARWGCLLRGRHGGLCCEVADGGCDGSRVAGSCMGQCWGRGSSSRGSGESRAERPCWASGGRSC
eukprot:4046700-Pyramimonas_sp.AAC.1